MLNKQEYYIEWWYINGAADKPRTNDFSIKPSSLNYFIKLFTGGLRKRGVVFLRNNTTNQVIINRRPFG